MKSRRRLVVRLLLPALLLTLTAPSKPVQSDNQGLSPSASMRPEVRLRKLHLVRPDLIPYPIAYEVYC